MLLAGKRLVAFGRRAFLHGVEIDTADLAHHIAHVAEILGNQLVVQFVAVFVEFVVIHPFGNVGEDVFQVLDAVVAGLDGVVAQVLGQRARVVHAHELLTAVAVERIACFFVNPFLCDGFLFLHAFVAGDGGVEPLDGIIIIHAQVGRGQFQTFVAGLRHIVVAGVIHDGWGGAVFLREGGVAQRIHRIGVGGGHVVHESQRVSHFMGGHIDEGLVETVLRQFLGAHGLVHLRCLDKAPLRHQFDHVVVNDNGSVDNLAGRGVYPARPHGIGHARRNVADAGVFQIVGVEFRVVDGKIFDADGILEADGLESFVPIKHAFTDGRLPMLREIRVEIEDDGLHGLYQLAALPGLPIRRLQPPAVGVSVNRGAVHG